MAKSAPETTELTTRDMLKEEPPDENRQYLHISTSIQPHHLTKNNFISHSNHHANVTLVEKHVEIPSDDKTDEVPLASGSKHRTTDSKEHQSISLSDIKNVFQSSPSPSTLPQTTYYDRIPEEREGNYADAFQALLHQLKLNKEGPEKNLPDKPIPDDFIDVQDFPMDIGPSCHAYIINNENFDVLMRRRGSDKDQKVLEEAFEAIDFKTSVDNDLRTEAMKKRLIMFIEKHKKEHTSIAIIAILTHGGKGDILYGTDGQANTDGSPRNKAFIKRTDVEKIFRRLRGTSKLLIIQACRGEKEYQPNDLDDSPSENTQVRRGMLFTVNMAPPGCEAYREPDTGSFCLQELAKRIKEKAHSEDFQTIFDWVVQYFQTKKLPNDKYTCPQMSTRDDAQLYLIDTLAKSSSSGSRGCESLHKDIRGKIPGI